MEEKLQTVKTIKTLKLKDIEYDSSSHPSEKGTEEMIRQIDQFLGNDLVMEEAKDEIVAPRKYSQVQPIYKVGCRGCDYAEFTQRLCTLCLKNIEVVDTLRIEGLIEEITKTMYPDLEQRKNFTFDNGQANFDFDMKEPSKRGRNETNDDDSNRLKAPRT